MGRKYNSDQIESGVYKHEKLVEFFGSAMAVKRALASGKFERITRGFYATTDIPFNRAYYLIIKNFYKKAVISKRTLLYHYRLTTNQPEQIDIDVPQQTKLRHSTDLLEIHRTNKLFSVSKSDFNGVSLRCYSVERALFEVLYFEKTSGSLTSEVIHNFLAHFKYEPALIYKIGLRFGKPGLQLAKLIQVVAGDKYRLVSSVSKEN